MAAYRCFCQHESKPTESMVASANKSIAGLYDSTSFPTANDVVGRNSHRKIDTPSRNSRTDAVRLHPAKNEGRTVRVHSNATRRGKVSRKSQPTTSEFTSNCTRSRLCYPLNKRGENLCLHNVEMISHIRLMRNIVAQAQSKQKLLARRRRRRRRKQWRIPYSIRFVRS